ncbi:MAG: hypothetical protein IKQ68_07305 [Prevotella sp.]|nr:hypothetical protein [Prevotella sp.]
MKKNFYLILWMLAAAMTAAAQSDVTANVNSYNTTTMSNGIVSLTISAQGKITSCTYNGSPNLISTNGGVYFSCNEPDYHELSPNKAQLKVNTADMAEVVYTNESPLGVKWSHGFILRKGESGVYMYIVAEGNSNNASLGEARIVYRMNDALFNYGYVTDAMHGYIPSTEEMKRSEERKVQDATFILDDGTIYTKYNWANYIKDDPFHGVMGSTYGAWTIPASPEYINGGPTRQELTVHADTKSTLFLQMLHGGHFGAEAQTFSTGEKKIYGPFLLYFNSGSSHNDMIADAAAKAEELQEEWPFQWFDNDLYDRERATVSGKILVNDALQTSNIYRVVLSKTSEPLNEDNGYIFWTETNTDGTFSIPNVRKDTYVLTAYALNGSNTEQLTKENIVIEGTDVNLGTITWTPEKFNQNIFQIGESDRLSDGFKLSDMPRAYENYQQVPADLTFTVGESDPSTGWYYAQTGISTWTIRFKAGEESNSMARLTAAAAAISNLSHLYVRLNGTQIAQWDYDYNDGALYRSAMQSGRYHNRYVNFGASRLKANDWNTIEFEIKKIDGNIGGIMWDCVKLEIADDNTEYCDFAGYGDGVKPTYVKNTRSGGQDLQVISIGDETFNKRIAVGTATMNATSDCFKFRDVNATYYGLYSQNSGRYISVLSLHNGDRVTIDIAKKDTETEALKFSTAPAIEGVAINDVVESGRTYTISTTAKSTALNLVSTGSVYIKSIRIDGASTTGVQEVETKKQEITENYMYDLMGRRIINPVKGKLYIKNGKKIIF